MRALLRLFVMTVVLFPLIAGATVINIPDDYPTIQEGINHGADGDTVLVQPDIYYENLNFNGHDITLASLFLTTGDTAYISTTIIDGDSAGSVITFESGEDSTAQVVGFTITGGYHGGGGIYCYYSSPTISNNIINGNSSSRSGGGIYCYYSSPTISNNTISSNSVDYSGGGICCFSSSPTIANNIINGNWASRSGGGIECVEVSNPTINNNIICENSAHSVGGGIYCYAYSNPKIKFNTISGNSANVGGGIGCQWNSDPWIRRNIIKANSAVSYGGGIYSQDSSPTIRKSTISGNLADYGGGIYCLGSGFNYNPTITNTNLWGDTAPNGLEIYDSGGNLVVTYCDVQGGWPGQGNIDADPVFVGPEREDFHLRWRSPCIDAGDPDFPLDPDGTRSDIGAFYFNQDVPGIVELYPHDTPIVIPPEGGDAVYDGWVFNTSDNPLTVDIRGYLYLDGVGRYHRVHKHKNVPIPVGDSVGQNGIINTVPSFFPAGDYTLVAYIGVFPHTIIDSCYFYFTKTGSIGSGTLDGLALKGWFREANPEGSSLPVDYSLFQNYPNPFNATTTIQYQLAENGQVVLDVCNLFGQKVATLVDSKQQAGYKSVSWDASKVSSGLYFYRLSAGDYTETRRMMLVK